MKKIISTSLLVAMLSTVYSPMSHAGLGFGVGRLGMRTLATVMRITGRTLATVGPLGAVYTIGTAKLLGWGGPTSNAMDLGIEVLATATGVLTLPDYSDSELFPLLTEEDAERYDLTPKELDEYNNSHSSIRFIMDSFLSARTDDEVGNAILMEELMDEEQLPASVRNVLGKVSENLWQTSQSPLL